MEIQVKYDGEVDALYIRFKAASGRVVTHVVSERVAEYIALEPQDIAFDFDQGGKIVGMEVLSASKYFEAGFLSQAESKALRPVLVGAREVDIGSL
mgnify:FL=1